MLAQGELKRRSTATQFPVLVGFGHFSPPLLRGEASVFVTIILTNLFWTSRFCDQWPYFWLPCSELYVSVTIFCPQWVGQHGQDGAPAVGPVALVRRWALHVQDLWKKHLHACLIFLRNNILSESEGQSLWLARERSGLKLFEGEFSWIFAFQTCPEKDREEAECLEGNCPVRWLLYVSMLIKKK